MDAHSCGRRAEDHFEEFLATTIFAKAMVVKKNTKSTKILFPL